jgi:hypothetical protein
MNQPKFVICIENSNFPASLEKRKIYEVVPDVDAALSEHIRVIDPARRDTIYARYGHGQDRTIPLAA